MTGFLLQIGATKLVLAAVLAGMAWLVQQRVNRPATVHAMWLLVLGAMLVPAVVPLRVLPEEVVVEGVVQAENGLQHEVVPLRVQTQEVAVEAAAQTEIGPPVVVTDAGVSEDGMVSRGWLTQNAKPLAVLLWFLGSAGFFGWTMVRTVRFQRMLTTATRPATQLQRLTTEIGETLGLPRVPRVYTTSARLRPLVWWAGGCVRILIPSVLVADLDEAELRAVLAHELAHVRRRDYLVRAVEMLACSAYWWNPIVWWAKRRMRSAEESSCDILAVSASRLTRDRYAKSLLRVVEVMSAVPIPRAPALASPADSCRDSRELEKRLRAVLTTALPELPTAGGFRVAGAVALAFALSLGLVYCTPGERFALDQPQVPTPAMSGDRAGIRSVLLEIDYATGRTIIDDERRSMRTADLAVDRSRGILYVIDAEEKEGVMAFSLETGEWVRTIRTPRGNGLREFPNGRWSAAVAADGGLYVSGPGKVVGHDELGAFVSSWSPGWKGASRVCDFGGEPAVPMRTGVMRRGPEETDDPIPAEAAEEGGFIARSPEEALAFTTTHVGARIACTGSTAYVVRSYLDGPDSVFAYRRNGQVGRVSVPTDFAEWEGCEKREVRTPSGQPAGRAPCWVWNRGLTPSTDGRGNLVLLGVDFDFAGTIVNPETGCYAIVRKDPSTDKSRIPVRILGDSALVLHNFSEPNANGGTTYYTDSAYRVSLHPLRRVSGKPCPGMLPSLNHAGDGGAGELPPAGGRTNADTGDP